MIGKQIVVLATKGEYTDAETVGSRAIKVVEFFDPAALTGHDEDTSPEDGITMDLPAETWERMDSPTEITITLEPGNLLPEDLHRIEDYA